MLALCLLSALKAAAQSSSEVADRMMSLHLTNYASAQTFRNLVTLDVSPEIWTYISDTNVSDGLQQISSFSPGMWAMAKNMGWGDLQALVYNNPGQPENPLITQMVDSWKGKMSLKLVCNFKPTGQPALSKALRNICAVAHSLEEERIKPRSGKMFLTITASPTATTASVKASPDGTSFNTVVPVYADFDPESLATAFAKCAAGSH